MARWQLRQVFAQAVTSVERPFHRYLEEMRWRVAQLPGWGPVEVFENLSPEVSGYQRAEGAGGGVANEVKVANLLCDDAQAWAGTESLHLWAKDLAEGHIL